MNTAFKETRDRGIGQTYPPLPGRQRNKPIGQLPPHAPVPPVERYAYRSFDRQWILADNRLGDFLRPDLWTAYGDDQVYLTTLINHPLGQGPALTAAASVPDLHHFRGSYGAKEVAPLYRDASGKEANILPGAMDVLAETYAQKSVAPEDLLAYVYGVLAQPAFTAHFADELGSRELRVPLTKNAVLFNKAREIGVNLLWLHTYGQRFVPKGKHKGRVPKGRAKCAKPVPGDSDNYPEKFEYNEATETLRVGDGEFKPVSPEVYEFEVSGLKVAHSWLGYRIREPKGKKSSPLDSINTDKWPAEFTTELLWVLEATVAEYPKQAKLLDEIVRGPCFKADELPTVPDAARKPPARPPTKGLFAPEPEPEQQPQSQQQQKKKAVKKPRKSKKSTQGGSHT